MKKSITRHVILIVLLCIAAWFMFGCRSIQYVPVETVKIEYMDRLKIDSVIKYDSIFYNRYMKGDTVFMIKEKYKHLDKIKIVRDSVFSTDSISVPYPVEKQLSKWEKVKMDFGGVSIGVASCLLIILAIYIIRRFI
ncbi:hypothetical protein [uncultured Dysgonomonas sp.]|uniref:Lipoprotein n=1 Tax=uncultured Dysgonomonas sp. TaxID=206096 RepID=A0A212IXG4_9BACT|nr:hypothetical protein [uncultured Dysgonomonas sp.]SBV91867.1 conserved exported hypothetical protein [uncultured Dysgonomonas sp.]